MDCWNLNRKTGRPHGLPITLRTQWIFYGNRNLFFKSSSAPPFCLPLDGDRRVWSFSMPSTETKRKSSYFLICLKRKTREYLFRIDDLNVSLNKSECRLGVKSGSQGGHCGHWSLAPLCWAPMRPYNYTNYGSSFVSLQYCSIFTPSKLEIEARFPANKARDGMFKNNWNRKW